MSYLSQSADSGKMLIRAALCRVVPAPRTLSVGSIDGRSGKPLERVSGLSAGLTPRTSSGGFSRGLKRLFWAAGERMGVARGHRFILILAVGWFLLGVAPS